MTDSPFIVKNQIQGNTSFVANSTSANVNNLIAAGTVSVTGNVTFSNTFSVTGNASFANTLSVTGVTTLSNNLVTSSNVSFGGGTVLFLTSPLAGYTNYLNSGNTKLGNVTSLGTVTITTLVGTTGVFVATNTSANATVGGWLDIKTHTESTAAPVISSGTLTLDCNTATVFLTSLNAAVTTMNITNVPSTANHATSLTLVFTADGTARAVSWPGSVVWPSGVAPSLTSTLNKRDVFTLMTTNAGTEWLGFISGQNI